ncbi:hypothetical protein EYB33_00245 (plasmid) [Lysinibacillus sphaericus]|nr:hypothetical protein [Lysinibacillus sphaericus]UDK94823.1 hypothetical protein EYB33_00245 [Lysinibacillus sphaericus]
MAHKQPLLAIEYMYDHLYGQYLINQYQKVDDNRYVSSYTEDYVFTFFL